MDMEAQYWGVGMFARQGFSLNHPDDHVVVLRHEGEQVARFSQLGTTKESIQAECARHLVMRHGWSGELWKF